MAEKRMFTKRVTDSDAFISLPSSTQALYLHLCQDADDDGFNNHIQMAIFKAHASIDDVKLLLTKRFILQFESGVIVIKHWRMANALRKDRYTPTVFQEELSKLKLKDNQAYTDNSSWLPNGCQAVAADKNSIDKNRLDKLSIDKKDCFAEYADGKKELLDALLAYRKMRKAIKSPQTEEAEKRLLKKLDSLFQTDGEKIEALYEAVEHNWKSVYAHDKKAELANEPMPEAGTQAELDNLNRIIEELTKK